METGSSDLPKVTLLELGSNPGSLLWSILREVGGSDQLLELEKVI